MIRKLLRPHAARLASLLWRVFGVTHDPRVYKCRVCGKDCRRVHDHMTMGHAERLCSGCFPVEDRAGRVNWNGRG